MTPTPSAKAPLSEIEANWYTHLAGIQAEKEARELGVTQSDGESLLDAACGGRIIGGIKFPPIHGGFMMMLGKAQKIAEKYPEMANESMGTEMGHLGALAFILHAPELAWTMLKRPDCEPLFVEAVIELSMKFGLVQLREIVEWIAEDMSRLQRGGDSAGKPAAE